MSNLGSCSAGNEGCHAARDGNCLKLGVVLASEDGQLVHADHAVEEVVPAAAAFSAARLRAEGRAASFHATSMAANRQRASPICKRSFS
jgi:hypothetical protein